MIKTKLDNQSGIVYVKMEGVITLEQLVDHVSLKESRQYFPRDLKLLTDARQAILSFNIDALNLITDEMQKTLQKYNRIIDAFLVENTKETAMSVLYMEMAKINHYIFRVFNTEEAALRWLSSY